MLRRTVWLLFALSACRNGLGGPKDSDPVLDGGCPADVPPNHDDFWAGLWQDFLGCIVSHSTADCRSSMEQREWGAIPGLGPGYTTTALLGTIAPGGETYQSPELAPEGDLCVSHDDVDWNWNVYPDPAYASLLQKANLEEDADHPGDGGAGAVEAEWEAMYVDPAYQAEPSDAGGDYHRFASPHVDMEVGDRVGLRGAAVLDCGHSPFRSELHPPYLVIWGGLRDGGTTIVHVRASAQLSRPAEFSTLADPPSPGEALTLDVPLPPAPDGGTLAISSSVDWFLEQPTLVVDHGCDATAGAALGSGGVAGPSVDQALASPAAHLVAPNQPELASQYFSLGLDQSAGRLLVTLTPLSRPHQALFGATVVASWAPGPLDGGP
ncbi:MAG: hypothetical protein ACYCWW_14440 [Deltaproteobacteria bacterium]